MDFDTACRTGSRRAHTNVRAGVVTAAGGAARRRRRLPARRPPGPPGAQSTAVDPVPLGGSTQTARPGAGPLPARPAERGPNAGAPSGALVGRDRSWVPGTPRTDCQSCARGSRGAQRAEKHDSGGGTAPVRKSGRQHESMTPHHEPQQPQGKRSHTRTHTHTQKTTARGEERKEGETRGEGSETTTKKKGLQHALADVQRRAHMQRHAARTSAAAHNGACSSWLTLLGSFSPARVSRLDCQAAPPERHPPSHTCTKWSIRG